MTPVNDQERSAKNSLMQIDNFGNVPFASTQSKFDFLCITLYFP